MSEAEQPIPVQNPTPDDLAKAEGFFLEPKGYRVIVLEDEFDYRGKIIIPETAKQRPTTGTVVAVAPEHAADLAYLDGEHIVYARFSGTLIQFKNRPAYRVLAVEEILAIIRTDEKVELEDTGA